MARTITFNVALAEELTVQGAVLLDYCQMRHQYYPTEPGVRVPDVERWFQIDLEEVRREVCLKPTATKRAIKTLVSNGYVDVKAFKNDKGDSVEHYKLSTKALELYGY